MAGNRFAPRAPSCGMQMTKVEEEKLKESCHPLHPEQPDRSRVGGAQNRPTEDQRAPSDTQASLGVNGRQQVEESEKMSYQ